MRDFALIIFLSFLVTPVFAQQRETGFLDRTLTVGGALHRYQVYVPPNYDSAIAWPVILSLHGFGERGDDGLRQTLIGAGSGIRHARDRWPAIVVFPQAPRGSAERASIWQTASDIALAALDRTEAEFNTDSTRVYLTGLSQGGHGTWYVAYHHPRRFAALAVVCGWVVETGRRPGIFPAGEAAPYAKLAERLKHLPIWIFHGDKDAVIPVEESRRMHDALRAVGAAVKYTEIPDGNHNAWDPAYLSAELPAWLLSQRR